MLNIGSRSSPSVLNLVLIVIVIIAVVDYVLVSLGTEDWIWFLDKIAESPNGVIVHCYGQSINLDRDSNHFSALGDILNEIMSRQRRFEPLSMSMEIYQDYQQSSAMVTIEFLYPATRRVQIGDQIYSSVDNLVVPLEGPYAQTDAILGQNQGVPTAKSLHINSTDRLKEYLRNQNICLTATSIQ